MLPRSTPMRAVLCMLAGGLSLCSPAVSAQEASQSAETPSGSFGVTAAAQADQEAEQNLKQIEDSISISKDRADELRQQIAEMNGDRAQQNAELIAAAQRVKLAEIEIGDTEDRLDKLLTEESGIRQRLDSADVDVATLLSALERISMNPPPALVINPTDALSSARSAILLSAVLPQLRGRADKVMADLEELTSVKDKVLAERDTLSTRLKSLQEEQLRIATLIEARRQGVERAQGELDAEEQQATELASQADSLNQLIASLRQRIEAVDKAAQAAEAADQGTEAAPLSDDTIRIALANTDRTEPAVPFPDARGHLSLPAAGVVVTGYGQDDGFGGLSKGMSIVTRAEAQVVAPADGWVMYKGPYLNYGQIVILNPGQGYTILLAGLDAVDVDLGQFVLLGEPIGTMGSRTFARAVTTSAGVARPTLYIELRNQNGPLDPTSWWAGQTQNTTRSG